MKKLIALFATLCLSLSVSVSALAKSDYILEYNGITLVESSLGFHIIKRLPITREDVSDKVEGAAAREKLDVAMNEWKTQARFNVVKNEELFRSIS